MDRGKEAKSFRAWLCQAFVFFFTPLLLLTFTPIKKEGLQSEWN